ncbi:glycosyltransferase [Candidatus Dependentiae bacterium]|nr:glycosyltransferase [Candidatus Dependentiae bacterium]
MKQKKETAIIYIITKLELGGAQKICLSLFNETPIDTPFDSFLITGPEGKLVSEVSTSPHVHFISALKREVSGLNVWQEFKALISLIHTLRTIKKDYQHVVVHTHSTKAGIYGRLAAWIARIPVRIHTIHGYGFHQHQRLIPWLVIVFLEWMTSLITTHFVCVSSHDADIGRQFFPRFAKKHSLIRAAVDTYRMIPAYTTSLKNFDHGEFIFGSIACFKPQKNLIDLLQAFEQAHHLLPYTKLEIIGDGILRPHLEQWIREHNLTTSITLYGWQHDVQPFLARWHAFTLSSLWEGLPCAIVEARMHHLPVVCYDTGGIKDVIIHGKNGLLCAQKDWNQLAHHMIAIASDKDYYHQLRIHHDDLKDFEQSTMTSLHKKLYATLLSQKST